MKHKLLNGKTEILVQGQRYYADKDGFVDLPIEVSSVDCEIVEGEEKEHKPKEKKA